MAAREKVILLSGNVYFQRAVFDVSNEESKIP